MYDLIVLIRDKKAFGRLVKDLGLHDRQVSRDEWTQIQKGRDVIGEFLDVQRKSVIYQHEWRSLPPKALVMPILRIKLPIDSIEQQYLAKIYARNGTITQPIKLLKIDDKWEISTRIQKYDDLEHKVKEVFSRLHPKVPLEETYAGE